MLLPHCCKHNLILYMHQVPVPTGSLANFQCIVMLEKNAFISGFLKRLFEKTGCLMTVDGPGDEFITPLGLEDYHFKRHRYHYRGKGTYDDTALDLHACHVSCFSCFVSYSS